MAMKTDFTDADFISSPFVDEVANPSHTPTHNSSHDDDAPAEPIRGRSKLKREAGTKAKKQ